MFQSQSFVSQLLKVSLSLALALIIFVGYPLQALAEQKNLLTNLLEQIIYIFSPPKTRKLGASAGRIKGAAGRGSCLALGSSDKIPLTALAPLVPTQSNSRNIEQLPYNVWGRTVEDYPTFWFYIPGFTSEKQSEQKFGKFVLLDEERHIVAGPIYFKLPEQSSIAGFPLSKAVKYEQPLKPLKMDKEYNWYFTVICDARKPSKNPTVKGWIQRIPSISTPNGYLNYAQQGIWYDTVTLIARNRMATPQVQIQDPIQNDWLSLLLVIAKNHQKQEILNEISDQIEPEESANKMAYAPIVELTLVSENNVQSQ